MNGLIALVGSGEYLSIMDGIDRYLLAHCGADGRRARVACLPTAAGQEGEESVGRWMRMGEEHFRALGAEVTALHITNRPEADDPANAAVLERADLIYFSGGHPLYLYQTLQGSQAWKAAESAWERGAVYAGCSAGAMILGHELPDLRGGPDRGRAFGVLGARYIFPHFDRMQLMRPIMTPFLKARARPGEYSLGIDEETALVGRLGGEWQVMGRSKVYVFTHKAAKGYSNGQVVPLPDQPFSKEKA
jgi:cyanophycinase